MRTEVAERVGGCYCVVIHTNGQAEVKQFDEKDHTNVFDKAREYIGCKWLDNVVVQRFAPDVQMVYLVNDNGYAEWGNDPKKVNPIATYIYNGGNKPGHYILGDVVMCWLIDTPDGDKYIGMSKLAAARLCRETNEKLSLKAKEIVPIPNEVPAPVVKVMGFEDVEDMIRYQAGDRSVKPKEETIISGGNAEKQA